MKPQVPQIRCDLGSCKSHECKNHGSARLCIRNPDRLGLRQPSTRDCEHLPPAANPHSHRQRPGSPGGGHLARLAAEWVARLGAKPTGSWLQLKLVTDLRKALCLSEPQNCEMRV